MKLPTTLRTITCVLLCCLGLPSAQSETNAPRPAVESTVQIEVDFIEFESTPGIAIPERFAAKQTTLPTLEAENLVQLLVRGGLAKLRSKQRASLQPGKVTQVSGKELKTSDSNDPFADSDSGVTISVGGVPHKFTTRTVGAELELVLGAAGPEPIKIDATLQQTCFEGFLEYGGKTVRLSGDKTVITPPGFYQPIFSTASRQEKLALKPDETVALRVDWTDCKTDKDYSEQFVSLPGSDRHKTSKTANPLLILLRLRATP